MIFISCFCDLMMQSPLLTLIFPNCLIYEKTSNMRGLPQKRNTSESILRKQSSVCSCMFLCEYNPFFVEISSCCHLYGGPSCSPPYFLKSPFTDKVLYLSSQVRFPSLLAYTLYRLCHSQFISTFPYLPLKPV